MKNILLIIKKFFDMLMFYVKNPFDGIKSSADILLNEFINSAEGKKFIEEVKSRITGEDIDAFINEVFDRLKIKIPSLAIESVALEDIIVSYLKKKIKAVLIAK